MFLITLSYIQFLSFKNTKFYYKIYKSINLYLLILNFHINKLKDFAIIILHKQSVNNLYDLYLLNAG
jgi:hypothetical protein